MSQLIQFEGRTVVVIAPDDLEALERDAARWRYAVTHATWHRWGPMGSDPGRAAMLIELPYDTDLSCKAMRNAAIDAALERQP